MTGPEAFTGIVSPLSKTGVNHAFATAQALLSESNGFLLPTTAAGGAVPVQKMNLLADIIAGCINSSDPTQAGCSTLFNTATSTGASGGAVPADTVTALLNIAHNPGLNVQTLSQLALPASPYQPLPSTQPNDLTLAVTFPLAVSLPFEEAIALNPNIPTVDANGNVVVPGIATNGAYTVAYNFLGAPVTSTFNQPQVFANIWAIDANGYGWAGNANPSFQSGVFGRLTPSTGAVSSFSGFSGYTQDAAIDASGNIDVAAQTAGGIYTFSSSGQFIQTTDTNIDWTAVATDGKLIYELNPGQGLLRVNGSPFPGFAVGGGISAPSFMATDASDNVWVTNGNSTLSKFTCSSSPVLCSPASPSTGYTGGGLSFNTAAYATVPVVLDGASNPFIPNYAGESISQFSNAGVPISPSTGYTTGCNSKGLAVDGSGNVWVTCDNQGYNVSAQSLIEFLGLATPVATPILPAQLGVRP